MIFVTGGTGFVGAAVIRRLLARGHEVRALHRATSNLSNLEGLAIERVSGDLRQPETFSDRLEGCDGLFHVAADYRLWTRNPADMFATNVDGSVKLLQAAADAGISRMVYTSSVATLGINGDGTPANEDTPVSFSDMIGPYKQSKFRGEEAVRQLQAEGQLPIVIVNPSTPIGPRDIKPTPTGRMIVEAASGRMPAYVDTGLNVAHVDDVAEGHILAFEKGVVGERYVLGGDDLALPQILEIVAERTGGRAPTLRIPHGAIMPIAYIAEFWTRLTGGNEPFVTVDGVRMARKRMYFASTKAERDLEYKHRPADQAIADAVTWFGENGYLG